MARGRTTPTTLREISKARAKKIKERMVALGSAGELSVTEIAAAVNEEFAVALSRESVYSVLKRSGIRMEYAYIDGSKAQVKRREESLDQLRSELQENAAAFLADYRPLAPVPAQLRATRLEEMGFDSPIEAIIPFHDLHFGSFIDPRVSAGFAYYDPDVARERLVRWRNLVLRFTQREQLTTTLENAHLLALGDDIEGHGEMFGTQKLGMAEPVGFQVLGFVDDMSNVLLSYLERYKHITVYKVHGNHGRITAKARDSYPPDNLELTAWGNIADRVRVHTGGDWLPMTPAGVRVLKGGMIDFYIASSPVMLLEILAFKFLIMHGHGVKGLASTYTGAIDTKLRYNSIIGETINYLVKAHLHESQQAEHEIGGAIIQGSCFVGPSLLSISGSRPQANLPSQELFFMHPKHGKVHHEVLHLATVKEMRQFHEWVGRR